MDARVADFLLKKSGAEVDFEKSTIMGIVVPVPVIYEAEILGSNQVVLLWRGDRDSKQREFPVCVSPDYFNRRLAADPHNFDIWFVGSLSELKKSRFNYVERQIGSKQRNFTEATPLLCGIVSDIICAFEVVVIGDGNWDIISPTLYIKKERMSPGGVELEF